MGNCEMWGRGQIEWPWEQAKGTWYSIVKKEKYQKGEEKVNKGGVCNLVVTPSKEKGVRLLAGEKKGSPTWSGGGER